MNSTKSLKTEGLQTQIGNLSNQIDELVEENKLEHHVEPHDWWIVK